jgi:hypothetical protein
MCALRIGPSFVYTLSVHRSRLLSARNTLRELSATVQDNPFAPYVNLEAHDHVETGWWYLRANGKSWGSRGIS